MLKKHNQIKATKSNYQVIEKMALKMSKMMLKMMLKIMPKNDAKK
jgi:hypothetical protein